MSLTSHQDYETQLEALRGEVHANIVQRDKYPEGSTQWTAFDNLAVQKRREAINTVLDFPTNRGLINDVYGVLGTLLARR